ncbi:gamma-glutamylcyclotransferase [Rhodovulum viride]|uniref:Gamma-glutamylcyclotransferase n=1 Tax=Rhodovulum viride TaxID=1231134 RepID=A0ABX9DDR3_9RHOB|nr:gamma-glutamylcyclotransferase [Rhodovulum viride]
MILAPARAPRRRDHVLHFAYGIELHPDEIARMCPGAELVARATLPGSRLGFFGHSRVWDGAEEATVADPGAVLPGVLYRMSLRDADALEAARGVRLNGTGVYFHHPAEVLAEDGRPVAAVMLMKTERRAPRPPSAEYLCRIAEGAELRGLPAAHVAALRGVASVPASYPVPCLAALPFSLACQDC